jgi:hypothetical protein
MPRRLKKLCDSSSSEEPKCNTGVTVIQLGSQRRRCCHSTTGSTVPPIAPGGGGGGGGVGSGAAGAPGIGSAIIPYATGGATPITVTADVAIGGLISASVLDLIGFGSNLTTTDTAIGVSGVLPTLNFNLLPLLGTTDYAFTAPRAVTLTGLAATLQNLTLAIALDILSLGFGATFSVTVYVERTGLGGSNIFDPTVLSANFVFTGPIATPTTQTAFSSATAVPVAAGQRILLVAGFSSITGVTTLVPIGSLVTLSATGISAGLQYV